MREERLLERIMRSEHELQRSGREDARRAINSIVDHLQRILNTKQGSVLIGDDYGLPDLVELLRAYPESVRDFERSIRSTIQKYEPRLNVVRIKLVPQEEDPLSLSFQISAKLVHNSQRMPILLQSSIGVDGKIKISD